MAASGGLCSKHCPWLAGMIHPPWELTSELEKAKGQLGPCLTWWCTGKVIFKSSCTPGAGRPGHLLRSAVAAHLRCLNLQLLRPCCPQLSDFCVPWHGILSELTAAFIKEIGVSFTGRGAVARTNSEGSTSCPEFSSWSENLSPHQSIPHAAASPEALRVSCWLWELALAAQEAGQH